MPSTRERTSARRGDIVLRTGQAAAPDKGRARRRLSPVAFCAALVIVQGAWLGALAYLALRIA